MSKKCEFKAGQYYAAKYHGDNGDLIVGRVKSVRTTGEVILVNLLSGKIATKGADVLRRRNKRITKEQADKLVKLYEQNSKEEVRKRAVDMKSYTNGKGQMDLPLEYQVSAKGLKKIDELVNNFVRELKKIVLEYQR